MKAPPIELLTGKTYVLVGPSGSGKSLFLRSLFGWTAANLPAKLSPAIGAYYLNQDPGQGLTPSLSIRKHFRELGSGNEWWNTVETLLTQLHLPLELLDRKPHLLSGGERQRLMLAMVLVQKPAWLVCDEPTASLDPENQAALWDCIFALKKSNTTLLLATHLLGGIRYPIDSVLAFNDGSFEQEPFSKALNSGAFSTHSAPTPANAPDSSPPVLVAEKVQLTFAQRVLLRINTLQIRRGETVWISGPSGCGKSTLARFLAGWAPAQTGCLSWCSHPLAKDFFHRSQAQRAQIFYLFQHGTESFNPKRTVWDQLFEDPLPEPAQMQFFLERLHLANLDLRRTPDHFSIGEQQRLNLCRALGRRPKILLADEVLAPLDHANQTAVLACLQHAQSQWGMAVVLLGHDVSAYDALPGRVFQVIDKTLKQAGSFRREGVDGFGPGA